MKHLICLVFFSLQLLSLSTFAQDDYRSNQNSQKKDFHFTIAQEQGLTINLAERKKARDFKQISTANFHFGLSAQLDFKNYFASLGYYWHPYTVGTKVIDEEVRTGHESKTTSEFYSYFRAPIKIGVIFKTRKEWLTLAPFISANLLYSKQSGTSFTSNSYGYSLNEGDSIYNAVAVSMARPKKNVIAPGGGFMLSAGNKIIRLSLLAEYFQSSQTWTAIRASYNRYSQLYGYYSHTEYYNSKARTINISLSLGFKF